MIEVAPNLFVGNQLDYEKHVKGKTKDLWWVVHACKEPYHRQAVNYTTAAAPREHKEYLFAYRQDGLTQRLILNMVDAPKPEFFADSMIDEALTFIGKGLEAGAKVLVHCNQGVSRSASLALLHLRRTSEDFMDADLAFEDAEDLFRTAYPPYEPGKGIRAYVERRWNRSGG